MVGLRPFRYRAGAQAIPARLAARRNDRPRLSRAGPRKRKTAKIRHDREYRFVGDVVADEIGWRPLKGSCAISSRTPVALLKPECLISQTHLPGSTSIGAFGRSALISDTAS